MKTVFRPALIIAIVLTVYLGVVLIRADGDPLVFARLGAGFRDGRPLDEHNEGYDGQFAYFIAMEPNPTTAAAHLDVPAYRYQRLLYPMLARALAFGSPAAIPWTLLAVNIAAHLIGVLIVESWLVGHGISRWYALVYGLWAGLLMAVRLDLNEPLAYALAAGAMLAQRRGRHWTAAALGGLALFAKETTLLYWAAMCISAFMTAGSGRAPVFSLARAGRLWTAWVPYLVSALPFALFQWWLWHQFGSVGITSGGYLATGFEIVPYLGLARIGMVSLPALILFLTIFGPLVVAPSIWGMAAAASRLSRGDLTPPVLALAINAAFIPFTPFSTFREPLGLIRLAVGLVLATILYAAHTKSRRVLNFSLLWLAALAFIIKE